MSRSVIKQDNLLILNDSEYPIRFHILKSGSQDCYLVVDEDPFDMNLKLKNTKEVLALCSMFDPTITEMDLPRYATTQENQTTQITT